MKRAKKIAKQTKKKNAEKEIKGNSEDSLAESLVLVVGICRPVVQGLVDQRVDHVLGGMIIHLREESLTHFLQDLRGIVIEAGEMLVALGDGLEVQEDSLVMPSQLQECHHTDLSVTK
jgi:hypothetical protein